MNFTFFTIGIWSCWLRMISTLMLIIGTDVQISVSLIQSSVLCEICFFTSCTWCFSLFYIHPTDMRDGAKVAGSIPDGFIRIFHWYNPSGPGVDSASNRNEYQGYFLVGKGGRCVGLTTLPPSCAVCLEMLKSEPPWNLRARPGLYRDCFTFTTDTADKTHVT